MNDLIAYCGLDCSACEARTATINGDAGLRKKVAAEWSALNQVEITPEMINCTGCRVEGVKTPFCGSFCQIRKCAAARNMETCGSCAEMAECPKLRMITENNPQTLQNLR